MFDLLSEEASVSVKEDLVIVELEERAAMGDCEESNIEFFCFVVQLCLDVHADSAGALIQNSEHGLMVEKTSHCHTLLLTSRKDISPVVN